MVRYFLWILLLPLSFVWGQIQQTVEWTAIKEAVLKATPETWVVFDVDEVLIISEDAIFHSAHEEIFTEQLKRLSGKMDREALEEMWGIICLHLTG